MTFGKLSCALREAKNMFLAIVDCHDAQLGFDVWPEAPSMLRAANKLYLLLGIEDDMVPLAELRATLML